MADDLTPPLPGMPPDPPAGASPPAGVYIRRYKPLSRNLCDDCVRAIHALGVEKAPYPMVVRWQVSVGALTRHLCQEHKDQCVKENQR